MTLKPSGLVAATKRPASVPSSNQQSDEGRPNSRRGKKTIAFWADNAAARQLRRLAADEEKTIQDLMLEALDDLFRKRNLPRIAQESRAQ
jgi:hypothetical protein